MQERGAGFEAVVQTGLHSGLGQLALKLPVGQHVFLEQLQVESGDVVGHAPGVVGLASDGQLLKNRGLVVPVRKRRGVLLQLFAEFGHGPPHFGYEVAHEGLLVPEMVSDNGYFRGVDFDATGLSGVFSG